MKKEVLQERLQNHRDDLEAIELEIGKLEAAESFTHTQQIKTDWKDEIQDTIHQAVKTQLAYAHKKKEEIEQQVKTKEKLLERMNEESGIDYSVIQNCYEDAAKTVEEIEKSFCKNHLIKLTGLDLCIINRAFDLALELSEKRLILFITENTSKQIVALLKDEIAGMRCLSEKIKIYLPNRKEQGYDESN